MGGFTRVSSLELKYTSKKAIVFGFSCTFLVLGGVSLLTSVFMLSVLLCLYSTCYNFQSHHKSRVILPRLQVLASWPVSNGDFRLKYDL